MRKWSLDEKREQMRDYRKLPLECIRSFPKDLQTKRFPEAFATLWHFLYHSEAALKAGLPAAIPNVSVFVSHLW